MPRGPYGRPVNPDANGNAQPVRPNRGGKHFGKPYARPQDLPQEKGGRGRREGEVRVGESKKPRWTKAEKMNRKSGNGKPHRYSEN